MVLDPATLALISAVIAGLQVLAFVVLARLNPEMQGVRLWAWSSLAILFGTGFAHQKAGNSGRLGRVAPSPWRRYRARHG